MPRPANPPTRPQVIFLLHINGGTFADGLSATLEILEPGHVNPQQKYALPAMAELPDAYSDWQARYSSLNMATGSSNLRKIQPVAGQTVQRSYTERQSDCKQATIDFEDKCFAWFCQPAFEALRQFILAELHHRQLQQVPIQLDANTNDPAVNTLLRKLPWHLWALFDENLRQSELILNAPVSAQNHQLAGQVNILAVFGNQAGGLQLKGDLAALETHLKPKGASLTVLNQPSSKELQEMLWQQSWDILFFAGHSRSCNDSSGGFIHLKDDVVLSLRDLKTRLNKAVENGLKLAIFNSCDGLSLADYLAERKVPISIVMREPVPDRVARYFLEYFLEEFSQGVLNLQASVRVARERLQWLESDGVQACPAATWLPIICQNPNQSSLRWPVLTASSTSPTSSISPVTQNETQPITTPTPMPSPTPSPQRSRPQPPSPQPLPQNGFPVSHQQPGNPSADKLWQLGAILAVALIIVGMGAYIIKTGPENNEPQETKVQPGSIQEATNYKSLEDRFSTGDRMLITNEVNNIPCAENNKYSFAQAKTKGVRAMRWNQYEAATKAFDQAWRLCPSPEVMIYRNNARIGDRPAHTLAVAVPIDWPNPKNAIEMLRGAAQAQTLTNEKGGINGTPIKLMVIDDGDKPEVAKDIAHTLVDSYPEVLAVIGHWTSGVTLEAAKVYDAHRALTFMTPVSTTRDLKGDRGWVFRATINMSDAQEILADYAFNEAGYRKVATFSLDAAVVGPERAVYSEGLQDEFTQAFQKEGGQVVGNFDLAEVSFETDREETAQQKVRQAKKSGADAVMLIPDNTRVNNAQAIIREADRQGLGLLGVTNLYRQEVLKTTCPAMEGMVMTIAWKADGQANPEFVRAASSAKFWRGEVNFATAMTYNATQAMVTAMVENPTRMGIHDALNRANFVVEETADAQPMRFNNGDRTADAQLVRVVQMEKLDRDDNSENSIQCKFEPVQ